MSERIKLVRGDTGPQIKLTLTNEATGLPLDLTSATGSLHFRLVGSTEVLFSRALFIEPSTAADGVAYVIWLEGDLARDPGSYEGEIEIILQDGTRQTVYDLMKFRLRSDFQ